MTLDSSARVFAVSAENPHSSADDGGGGESGKANPRRTVPFRKGAWESVDHAVDEAETCDSLAANHHAQLSA